MRIHGVIFRAGLFAVALLAITSIPAGQFVVIGAQAPSASPLPVATQQRALLNRYCVSCHNDKLRTAGLDLSRLDPSALGRDTELWEKVLTKLDRRMMPPAGLPRPDEATFQELTRSLAAALDAQAAAQPNPGRPALHRLNRTEYANAVRDLLDLDIDVAALLPPDDSTHGFDNIGDVLGVSPLLLESYVNAARKVSRLALGNPSIPAVSESYWVARDETQDEHKEGMPFGTRGGLRVRHTFPVDGEYQVRIIMARNAASLVRGVQEPGHQVELAIDGERVRLFTLPGGREEYEQEYFDAPSPALTSDQHLVVRVPVKAGPHDITAVLPLLTSALTDGFDKPGIRTYTGPYIALGLPEIGRVEIEGPYNATAATDTPSRRRLLPCRPTPATETACAKSIIAQLARRAYRGLGTVADEQKLLDFYQSGHARGGFEAGIEAALARVLAGPKFLFRFEFDPASGANAARRISDLELASRLSFFLWSSIPDDQLLDVASRNELRKPGVLDREVRRMLADPRSSALVDNFAGQWLYLRNLENIKPDERQFPDFDNNLRQAFRRETELLFEAIVREDRSVLDLLNADYTFVNARLARHYGIPDIRGNEFRRVTVPNENRRGILGHGSILTVTSYANRTSPVIRGKWILENILGAPPPPPPPDVPELADNGSRGKILSMRERMAEHRANPVCASCHKVMDPLGFGLENFDAVGAWRTMESRQPIDASGSLPTGAAFVGPAEMRAGLMKQPEVFVGTMAGKMLTYALGRGVEFYDAPALRAITQQAAQKQYSFSSIVLGIVNSVPFQMRRALDEPTQQKAQ